MEQHLPYFRSLAFFEGLEDAVILALLQRLPHLQMVTGEELCRVGDRAGSAWVVIRGGLEILTAGHQPITHIKAGEAFGLSGLFFPRKRNVAALADSDSWLMEIDRSAFAAACSGEDGLGGVVVERIARLLAGQLRQIDGVLARLEAGLKARESGPSKAVAPEMSRTATLDAPRQATDDELARWIGEAAERAGVADVDSITVVHSRETKVRPPPVPH